MTSTMLYCRNCFVEIVVAESPAHAFGQKLGEFLELLAEHLLMSLTRQITLVRILPLHGVLFALNSVVEAIDFVENYRETGINTPVLRFEVEIRYGNGDNIQATLSEKEDVLAFLQTYLPVKPPS